ncbi:MAG: hypothetical protein JRF50_14995 [Deltaproteobacteria bacterium]|nr:hypothetical protein [Deltaproteobacteria bacterium]
MNDHFKSIICRLIQPQKGKGAFFAFDLSEHLDREHADNTDVGQALNSAFLVALAGSMHPASGRAKRFFALFSETPEWAEVAGFYLKGIDLVHQEIESMCTHDPGFTKRLETLSQWLTHDENCFETEETAEKMWSVFFPEATGIRAHEKERVQALRAKRRVTITKLNTAPLTDPTRQILFTSNVLLTTPAASTSPEKLPFGHYIRKRLLEISREPQFHWYDHPIQVGVVQEKNEVLYGLRALDTALEFERTRGNIPAQGKTVCVLSVSVTHEGLQEIAKKYLEEELSRSPSLKNIDIFVFTEADTQRIIDEILAPAAAYYLHRDNARELLSVFGADGEYGRHYSFLKAIAPFWSIFLQPEIRATFKIDLDQIFPQRELVEQTGASALEHFKTPLWGAQGLDSNEHPVELGMIAGALVDEADIGKSLFTPDVPFPNRGLSLDEYIFFSPLPQALSTEAEMMTRYIGDNMDGQRSCIQRIHVTGGTNGILVHSLRRYRPFTPSFIGRAEDQAYILSTLPNPGTKLAYVHEAGLIMRHDKEAFAQEAIESTHLGKLVGDYIRILYFSAYAGALTNDVAKLKDAVDPFTGCFISRIPITVVYLRLSFKAASLFAEGKKEQGLEFIRIGAQRIITALDFIGGENSKLKDQYEKERLGWNLYYDTLSAIENGIADGHQFALDLRRKAQAIIKTCAIGFG